MAGTEYENQRIKKEHTIVSNNDNIKHDDQTHDAFAICITKRLSKVDNSLTVGPKIIIM